MRVVLAAMLVAVGGLSVPAPASAIRASEWSVSIDQPATVRIHQAAGRATLAPVVHTEGNVRVLSKHITVRHGSITVAREVRRARVVPGSYNVTTNVTFQPFKLVGTGSLNCGASSWQARRCRRSPLLVLGRA